MALDSAYWHNGLLCFEPLIEQKSVFFSTMKKRIILFLLTFCISSLYAQQKTWDAKKGLSNHDWSREGIERWDNFPSGQVRFKTDKVGSNRFLHPVFIDYAKDFKISLSMNKSSGPYSFLFNASAGGAFGIHVEMGIKQIRVFRSMIAGNVGLYTKKNKKIRLNEPHELTIGKEQDEHYVILEQNGKSLELFRGRFPLQKQHYNLGFMMKRSGDVNIEVDVRNIQVTYTPSTDFHFVVNPWDSYGHKEKLEARINTKEHELSAIVSTDGKQLYYVRKLYTDGVDDQHIYETQLQEDGYSTPEKSKINYLDKNYLINISPDNNRAYVSGIYDKGRRIGAGISYRDRNQDGSWTAPKAMEIKGFETDNTEISNYISSDGQIVIASLEKDGGLGEEDLYVSVRGNDGEFGELINLGSTINSEAGDITPFLSADNQTLYFASESPERGFGSSDIYVSKRLDSTWQKWSQPVNMGHRINTADWEAYMSVPASGEYIYFVSTNDRSGQDADIYRIKLKSREVKPEAVTLLNGRVLDESDSLPLAAKIIYKDLETNRVIGEAWSDSSSGEFQLVLPYKSVYSIYAQTAEYYPKRDTINMIYLGTYRTQNRDLFLQKMGVGNPIRLNNIFFETGDAGLLSRSFDELENLLSILELNKSIEITIHGYTDNVGNQSTNLVLSKDRAKSVMNYLIDKGIDANRLNYQGFGEKNPLNNNSTEEKRQANRRVEFVITKM